MLSWTCILLSLAHVVLASTYKAAVLELPFAVSKEHTTALALQYSSEASQAGAQIIVFPEYALDGFPQGNRSHYNALFEEIPKPSGDIPCLAHGSYKSAPTVVALSCGARNGSIAIVAVLGDIVRCPNAAYPGCASGRNLTFSTALAFDTDGTFLAKYHKSNLWGDTDFLDVPQSCETSSFTTSFGVTFGLAMSADAIHEFPAERLVYEGVQNFVWPDAWGNAMAQMQASSWYQGWSLRNCANMLVASHPWHSMKSSASGSGIFACGQVRASYYHPKNSPSPIIYGVLESEPDGRLKSQVGLMSSNVSDRSGWRFAPLSSGRVCSGRLCCSATNFVGDPAGYAVGALDGYDSGCSTYTSACRHPSLNWLAQVCGVFSCRSADLACLTYQRPTGHLRGLRLEAQIHPSFAVYPQVLVDGTVSGASEQVLLQPGEGFNFSLSSRAVLESASYLPLTSASIYGRPYALDSKDIPRLGYNCPLQTLTMTSTTAQPATTYDPVTYSTTEVTKTTSTTAQPATTDDPVTYSTAEVTILVSRAHGAGTFRTSALVLTLLVAHTWLTE